MQFRVSKFKEQDRLQSSIAFTPIGVIHSCFKEKFGIPRQPRLNPAARATLELYPPYNQEEAFRGISAFSHLWIVFFFHASLRDTWKATVRPPRLGGNQRVGVFASRSNFRPNPIGLSPVRLERVERRAGTVRLHLQAVDFLDQTPVLDIKPYLPGEDRIPEALDGFAKQVQAHTMAVEFLPAALQACREREQAGLPDLKEFIEAMLKNDPRPGYYGRESQRTRFGARIYDFDLQWEVQADRCLVTALKSV